MGRRVKKLFRGEWYQGTVISDARHSTTPVPGHPFRVKYDGDDRAIPCSLPPTGVTMHCCAETDGDLEDYSVEEYIDQLHNA